jgi:hypothetical protein
VVPAWDRLCCARHSISENYLLASGLGKHPGRQHAGRVESSSYSEGDVLTCIVDLDGGFMVLLVNGVPCKVQGALAGARVARSRALHVHGLASTSGLVENSEQDGSLGEAGGESGFDAQMEEQVWLAEAYSMEGFWFRIKARRVLRGMQCVLFEEALTYGLPMC